jgi:hypothetical protein
LRLRLAGKQPRSRPAVALTHREMIGARERHARGDACDGPRKTRGLRQSLEIRLATGYFLSVRQIAVHSPTRVEMVPSFLQRAKHGVAGAFCVLLAVGLLAPATARAGCSHGVSSQLSRSVQESLSGWSGLDRLDAGPRDSAPASPRRDRPCSGLSCSQGQPAPPAPAPAPSLRSDTWCYTTPVTCWDSPNPAGCLVESFPAHPLSKSSPPERPPRHLSPRTFS